MARFHRNLPDHYMCVQCEETGNYTRIHVLYSCMFHYLYTENFDKRLSSPDSAVLYTEANRDMYILQRSSRTCCHWNKAFEYKSQQLRGRDNLDILLYSHTRTYKIDATGHAY